MGQWGGNRVAVAVVVVAAVAVYAVTDNVVLDNVCYLGVMIGASIGAWIGAERAPREARLVPRLIATGVSLTALGDVLWSVLDAIGADTDLSSADLPWFASYLFLCAALWMLGRGRGEGRIDADVNFAIDAVTIMVVSLLIFWSFTVEAIVTDQTATLSERTILAAYPVADAVLLALVVRVLLSSTARTNIATSFPIGVCLWLAADIAYLHTPESGTSTVLMDAAWMVAPVLIASAAWHSRELESKASSVMGTHGWPIAMTLAVAPLLVPPALELIADLRGKPDQPLQLFVGTAALIALAIVRTGRLMRSEGRALRELEVARDAALAATQAKSLFLANVSHEIRTPLTTVLATAEILEDTPLNDLQLKLLAKMHRSGELLKGLVEGILDFSRIEAGQLKLASTAFDLHAMVTDVADVYVPRALDAGIGFEWHLDPCVPRTVLGDSGRVFQILINLLDNALKFTHEGQVTLTVRPARPVGDGGADESIAFVVADSGIGIREEDLESVFETFRQIDGTMTRTYGGSGLGLAICKQLTQLMNGSLTVRSEFGAGSTFTLLIPIIPAVPDRSQGALVASVST